MQSLFVTPPSPLLTRKPFPTNPKDLAELSEKMGQVANEYLLVPKELTTVRSLPRCESCLSNLPTVSQLVSEMIEASSAVFSRATRQTSSSARFATYSADLSGLHPLMNGGLLTGAVDWYPARVGGHQANDLCLCSGKLLLAARPALEAANSLFSDRFMQGALEHYTAGLLWTPSEPVLPADAPPEALMNRSALAHGNRSVVYHRLRQWEATMAEVDRAIALGHGPFKKRSLLVKRKMECLLNLNRIAEAEALFREHERERESYEAAQRAKAAEANGGGEQPPVATAVTLLQQFQWQRLKAATEHGKSSTCSTEATVDGGRMATVAGAIAVLQAKGLFEGGKSQVPSGVPRWLSRKLQFKKEEEGEEGGKAQSKYLIALEPITAGEVLAVVKPLALVPLQAAHFGGTDAFGSLGARRCDHCQSACFLSPVSVETLRGRGKKDQSNGKRPLLTSTTKPPLLVRMPTPVPCSVCSQALYCGERCRDEAWAAYHRWECRLHSGQLAEKLGEPEVRLALRLLLAAGDVQALKEIATTLQEEGETEEEDFNYRLEYEKLVTSSGGGGGLNGPPGPARGTLTEEWAKMFTAGLLVQLLKACNFYEVGLTFFNFFNS